MAVVAGVEREGEAEVDRDRIVLTVTLEDVYPGLGPGLGPRLGPGPGPSVAQAGRRLPSKHSEN